MKKTIKSRKKSGDITCIDYSDGTVKAVVRGTIRAMLLEVARREGLTPERVINKALEYGLRKKGYLAEETTFRDVTFLVPVHIADLIEGTRDLVDEKWEQWGTNPFVPELRRLPR